MSSFAYQPKSTRISAHRKAGKWSWTLSDYYLSTIRNGDGCDTKKEALQEARDAKGDYIKNLPAKREVKKEKTNYGRTRGFFRKQKKC